MLKRRGLVLMVSSLVLALGAAWVARGWVTARLNAGPSQPMMQVVVAATDIPFGTKVNTRYLGVLALPANTPIAPHYSDPKQVVGLVALQQVTRGEILLQGQFAQHAVGSLLATQLKPGMRAISVPVNDVVGVAGFLLPGNDVDVVEARMQGNQAVTQTVLQDLEVLAVDQTDAHNKDQPIVVHAVTLEVTPQQADLLVKAMTEGRIQLTLRGPHSGIVPPTELVQTPQPKKRHRLAHPVPVVLRRPPAAAITIIRGTKIQEARPTITARRTS